VTQFRVVRAYRAAFDRPLHLSAGELVTLGKVDAEYPGWIWCTTGNGNSGWAPRKYLEIRSNLGRLLRDYDATELTLDGGEIVSAAYDLDGWVWCLCQDGRAGWIPANCLPALEQGQLPDTP